MPRTHKCVGQETKVRLRKELKAKSLIPEKIVEAGKTVGTKRGFCPILERLFKDGLGEWCEENLPSKGLTAQTGLRIEKIVKGHLWRKWRAATTNIFLKLLDEGRFSIPELERLS